MVFLTVFSMLIGYTLGVAVDDTGEGDASPAEAAANSLQSEPTEVDGDADDAATTTVAEPTTTSTTRPDDHRLYELSGGSVVVSFADGQVVVESTEPAAGFEVDMIEDVETGTQEVNFRREDGAHSQIRAWFDGGPQVVLDDHGF